MSQFREQLQKAVVKGAAVGAGLLVLFGIPISIVTADLLLPSAQIVTDQQSSPTPAPLTIPPHVHEAVKIYLAANWQGWDFRGYDPSVTVIDADLDLYRPTVVIENHGHSVSLNLAVIPLTNDSGTVWEAIPDTSDP